MAKCLVTGGAGFIGSHVVDLLLKQGHEVTVVDNLSTGEFENVNFDAKFLKYDISNPTIYHFLDNDYQYVFHLASLARIQPSIQDPIKSHETNVNGTLNILEFCRNYGAKLIFSGSSSIYKGDKLPTIESSDKYPKSPYALQKYISEQYIELYGKLYNLDYVILRYFNVYGERQILDGAYAAVVGILLDLKRRGMPLTITGDGEQRRDFTYVKDVARANLMAMDWKRDVYNIGTGRNYSINEIADMIGGEKVYLEQRKGEARNTQANNLNATYAGWRPKKDIKDWIYDLIS